MKSIGVGNYVCEAVTKRVVFVALLAFLIDGGTMVLPNRNQAPSTLLMMPATGENRKYKGVILLMAKWVMSFRFGGSERRGAVEGSGTKSAWVGLRKNQVPFLRLPHTDHGR